ncbi:MAG: nucleoside 2-deoxyribosyltransferase [Halieaceae bacterium]
MKDLAGVFESTESRIGAVCAAYVLYALVFFVFGRDAVQLWPEVLAIFLCAILTTKLCLDSEGLPRSLYAILTLSLISDCLNVFLLQLNAINPSIAGIPINSIFYGMHLFLWNIAWAAFAFNLASQLRETKTYLLVAPLLFLGVLMVLMFQLQHFQFDFNDKSERLDLIFMILELIGIKLGLLCVLMSVNRGLVVIVMGFTLAAGNDIIAVFDDIKIKVPPELATELTGYVIENNQNLDAFWALSKAIILIGLLMQFDYRAGVSSGLRDAEKITQVKQHHSGLSIYLLIFWLVTCSIAMFSAHLLSALPQILAMFIVLFSAGCVISMAIITARFDEVVVFLTDWISKLFANKLQSSDSSPDSQRTQRWLRVTALDRIVSTVDEAADNLRENVIFLGPERLNRPAVAVADGGRVSSFLVMPFHTEWSDAVSYNLRQVCTNLGISSLRGDDIFRPTDILDDIWNGITQCDFVIADITGNNANVFYELGMAHALGKPVLVLTQNMEEVPFDLQSRRILLYDIAKPEDLQSDLEGCLRELLEYYDFNRSDA